MKKLIKIMEGNNKLNVKNEYLTRGNDYWLDNLNKNYCK
jgi:hypothetical protein